MTYDKDDKFGHLQFIDQIVEENIKVLKEKDREYGASWKKRGGVSVYMMLARKWDRLENALAPYASHHTTSHLGNNQGLPIPPYDIITAAVLDNRKEGIQDDIKDLINYLILVMSEVRYQEEVIVSGHNTDLDKIDAKA